MNFLKRAQASVKRKPGKSFILLALVFILGAVIAGAVSIQQAVHNTERNLRRALPPVVTISQTNDWNLIDELTSQGYTWEELMMTPAMMEQISQLPQVVDFDYNLRSSIMIDEFVEYEPNPNMPQGGSMWWGDNPPPHMSLQVFGVANPDILDVAQERIEIVEGRAFTQEEATQASNVLPIVISRGFANENHLSVGSTIDSFIRFFPIDGDGMMWGEQDFDADPIFNEEFQLQVVGLFEIGPNGPRLEDENDWNGAWQQWQLANRVFMPNIAVSRLFETNEAGWRAQMEEMGEDTSEWGENAPSFDNIFVLYDLNEVDAFRESVMEIVSPMWRVQDLSSTFAQISGSMDTMLFIANIVLWVAIGATLIILSLLITLFLRDRRHEIGIYLALGERKGHIISQILLEVLSVSIVGIVLSLFAGNLISDGISRQMIQNNMMNAQNDMSWGGDWNPLEHMGFATTMTMEEMLESYEVSLDGQTVALFFLVGTGTVILSTAMPIIYVTSINPKKILM